MNADDEIFSRSGKPFDMATYRIVVPAGELARLADQLVARGMHDTTATRAARACLAQNLSASAVLAAVDHMLEIEHAPMREIWRRLSAADIRPRRPHDPAAWRAGFIS